MIPHGVAYNRPMKKILSLFGMLVLAAALAFALGGCININITQAPSGGSTATSGDATTSSSSAASGNAAASTSSTSSSSASASSGSSAPSGITVEKDGEYTDKDHVALYIHTYGTVPSNYVTKTKARKAGWVNTEGNLWDVLPGKSIGGGGFNNDDGTLPDAPGREWFECDIDYDGGYRNAKRIVYSDDGLVFYTEDHYNTFEQLY